MLSEVEACQLLHIQTPFDSAQGEDLFNFDFFDNLVSHSGKQPADLTKSGKKGR